MMYNSAEVIRIIQNLWTFTELKIGALAGTLWLLLDLALGGIDVPIKSLAMLIILDFITGITASFRLHTLSSSAGTFGILKKSGYFISIAIACLVDTSMQTEMFRGMVISGLAIMEAMSIIENIDRMGYGFIIPYFIRNKLRQIANEKYGKKD